MLILLFVDIGVNILIISVDFFMKIGEYERLDLECVNIYMMIVIGEVFLFYGKGKLFLIVNEDNFI